MEPTLPAFVLPVGALLPDDRNPGCGYGIFSTGRDDPFVSACLLHDQRYGEHERRPDEGMFSRCEVDTEFLDGMLSIADGDPFLTLRAYTYYGLTRIFGGLLW